MRKGGLLNRQKRPHFIAGTLKIIYDLLLYKEFVAIQPPEER